MTMMLLLSMLGTTSSGGGESSSGSMLSMFTGGSGAPAGSGGAGGGGMLSGLLGGLGGLLGLVGGGRGSARRTAARAAAAKSPALMQLRERVLATVPMGKSATSQIAGLVRQYASALRPLVSEAAALGGLGKAYGDRSNYLQDVFKYVLTGETVKPHRYIPTLAELSSWVGGTGPPAPSYGGPGSTSRFASGASGSYWAGHAYQPS